MNQEKTIGTCIEPTIDRQTKLNEDLIALRQSAGLVDLSDWTKLSVTGTDRVSFLHGMLSNDVKGLEENRGNYTLFLNAKGKIQADLWLYKRNTEILLLAHSHLKETLISGLNKFLIMDDAAINDRSKQWVLFALLGPKSTDAISKIINGASLLREWSLMQWEEEKNERLILRTEFLGEAGYFILCPPQSGEDLRTRFIDAGVRPVESNAINVLRIENGIPLCGTDITDNVIPQEASLHHALNFNKGCYIGQEVVARLQFRGHVNRELTGFVLHVDRAPTGDITLKQNEKEVGSIASVCHSPALEKYIGLGYLRCEMRNEGEELNAFSREENFKAIVTQLPFIQSKNR